MTSSKNWIFYDSLSKTQSNPISSDEAQMTIFKLKQNDWARFFIWTEGWTNWQPLNLFLNSDQSTFITQFAKSQQNEDTLTAVPRSSTSPMNSVNEKTHNEITGSFSAVSINDEAQALVEPAVGKSQFDGEELSWSQTEKPALNFKKLTEKMSFSKRATRHELKIEVLLISPKGKTFRSESDNISLSGSLLEDNIPFDYYGITFDAVIVNRAARTNVNARVSLRAKTVGEGLTQRISFHEITPAQKKALHELLQDYLGEKQKLTKKSS